MLRPISHRQIFNLLLFGIAVVFSSSSLAAQEYTIDEGDMIVQYGKLPDKCPPKEITKGERSRLREQLDKILLQSSVDLEGWLTASKLSLKLGDCNDAMKYASKAVLLNP